MRVDRISYRKKLLRFRHPFTISGGRTKTHQPVFQVAIGSEGLTGYGEAPEIAYYGISLDQMSADLDKTVKVLCKEEVIDPFHFYEQLLKWLPDNSFLRCALDMAYWDLFAKQKGKPVHACWPGDYETKLVTDLTIGIGNPDEMLARIEETPWPVYKIKLGFPGDIDVIAAIRKFTSVPIRVDVNGGWAPDEAVLKINQLKDLQIELVEQPLHKSLTDAQKALFTASPLALFADESCVSEADPFACVGSFHGINIKLTKCGGITPALRMISASRKLGLQVMMGSMNESSLGTAAIAQFLPQLDYVDMDGPLLLAEDTARGIEFSYGAVWLSELPGLGIEMLEPF